MKKLSILLLMPVLMFAQNINKNLINAKSFEFRKNIFVYGINQSGNDMSFIVYKFSHELGKTDSAVQIIGKENFKEYLEINSDTLHGFLNFYLQKSNSNNMVTLIRLNDSLQTIAKAEHLDVSKINSLTTFESEHYSFSESTYTIRSTEDSIGKQFFLTKYELLNKQEPFEYKLSWQYPLEKRNIHSAHIFYANNEVLFMYVNISSGEKKGQWILKINTSKGTLVKGIKLNTKGDTRNFIYSACHYDPLTKAVLVCGNVYNEQQIDFETGKYEFANMNKQNTYFFTTIDSTCENIIRNEKTVPFLFAAGKTQTKEIICHWAKCKEIYKTGPSDYSIYYSLYSNHPPDLLFLYETGFYMNISINESDVELYADKIYNSSGTIPGLITGENKDNTGKIEINSLNELDKVLYKWPVTDVEQTIGKDDLKNTKWVLVKNNLSTDRKIFYAVRIGLKGPEQKLLLESGRYNHPEIYKINDDKLIIFNTTPENNAFSIAIKSW